MRYYITMLCVALVATAGGLYLNGCKENKGNPDSTGLPGDNLDLYAVLGLFRSSGSLQEFEKALNDKNKGVNNLDLNGDGQVDYILVIDNHETNDHAIVLRVPLSENESQDVAVIGIEKTGEAMARLQVIGDEDLYGKNYIVEPAADLQAAGFAITASLVVVNVWSWPAVAYVYSPSYVVWTSPYYWGYYPAWWSPWTPVVYEAYYPAMVVYHTGSIRVHEHAVVRSHRIYKSHRVASDFRKIQRDNEKSRNVVKDNGRGKDNGGNALPHSKQDPGSGHKGNKASPGPGQKDGGKSISPRKDNASGGQNNVREDAGGRPGGKDGVAPKSPAPKGGGHQGGPKGGGGKKPGGKGGH
jgi:hypothetical protein